MKEYKRVIIDFIMSSDGDVRQKDIIDYMDGKGRNANTTKSDIRELVKEGIIFSRNSNYIVSEKYLLSLPSVQNTSTISTPSTQPTISTLSTNMDLVGIVENS